MKSFDLCTADRREMLLDKDRLHVIGLQHAPSWATGNLLRDMQQPPKKEDGVGSRRREARRRRVRAHDAESRSPSGCSPRCWSGRPRRRHQQEPVSLGPVAGAGAGLDGRYFLTLDAEFLAAVQVLLYAGGVVTVVVFAIVVTERLVGETISQTSRRLATGGFVRSRCFALLSATIRARAAAAGRRRWW
jgi:hypothetical protein